MSDQRIVPYSSSRLPLQRSSESRVISTMQHNEKCADIFFMTYIHLTVSVGIRDDVKDLRLGSNGVTFTR